jgi:hypothetical protein
MSKFPYVLKCKHKCECKDKHWCCLFHEGFDICVEGHDLVFLNQIEDPPVYFLKKEK